MCRGLDPTHQEEEQPMHRKLRVCQVLQVLQVPQLANQKLEIQEESQQKVLVLQMVGLAAPPLMGRAKGKVRMARVQVQKVLGRAHRHQQKAESQQMMRMARASKDHQGKVEGYER